jgi:hypothetical protein
MALDAQAQRARRVTAANCWLTTDACYQPVQTAIAPCVMGTVRGSRLGRRTLAPIWRSSRRRPSAVAIIGLPGIAIPRSGELYSLSAEPQVAIAIPLRSTLSEGPGASRPAAYSPLARVTPAFLSQ